MRAKTHVLSLLLTAILAIPTAVAQQSEAVDPAGDAVRTARATAPTAPQPPAPVFVRQSTFYIPFNVRQDSAGVDDVVLFASGDFGAKWDQYSRLPTTHKQFLFRAGRDGEYWFASRKVPTGAAVPQDAQITPELRIVVDTTEPKLALDAKLETNGEVVAKWEVSDLLLVAETVMLQYQTGPGQPWKDLEIDRTGEGQTRQMLRGEKRWNPESGATLLAVRIEAKDRADNRSELTRRLIVPFSLSTPFGRTPPPAAAAPTSDVPSDPLGGHGLGSGAPAAIPPAQMPPTQIPPAGQPAPVPLTTQRPVSPATQPESGTAWPSETANAGQWAVGGVTSDTSSASASRDANRVNEYADNAQPDYTSDSIMPDENATVAQPASTRDQRYADTDDRSLTEESNTNPESAADAMPSEVRQPARSEITDSAPQGNYGLPEGERPKMTNVQRFNLDYAVDAVGPEGVEKVELWVTRNGGRDWDLWGVDEDRQSPLLVEAEAEGIYGFRVVIVGRNGLASQTPRAGDLADLWVGVDTTKPVAEITSAAYGSDQYAGHLDIRWTATDASLGNRPVSLLFSDSRSGPWTTLAAGLPNTGQYHWRVDSRVPEKFFLRLEVRDEAGNLCTHQLDRSISSAGLVPRGRIRGIAPLSQ